MKSIIKLLPDSVANQIAAGEVIQRPASAAKELLENSIDSGATQITLAIKEAGKTLVQITDNGCGMSELDARMSFERHATSKIRKADDLFAIQTMGFRGEAMASIAAISQVELKSKVKDGEMGTCISIKGSEITNQEPCQCSKGTTISVKNLFYNVPARRNFLKSNNVELRHINEEFTRISLINPEIAFSYYNNDKIVYKLIPGGLKSRIAALFGNVYNERLISLEQNTDVVNITGFIGKPEFAKKTRGEQYFFVNGRFIKHPYLHHAVNNAYTELIPADSFPSYFISIKIDPKDIDVNIHPTKTEVNFQDARYVYAVLHAAVKQAIGKHSLTPTIDFDVNPEVEAAFLTPPSNDLKQPEIEVDNEFNPFANTMPSSGMGTPNFEKPSTENWESLYSGMDTKEQTGDGKLSFTDEPTDEENDYDESKFIQVQNRFIVCNVKKGLMVVDQNLAHFRIKYEDILGRLKSTTQHSQQQLFPQNINLTKNDGEILKSLFEELKNIGFEIEDAGKGNFVIVGVPADLKDTNIPSVIESIIENHKSNVDELDFDKNINIAKSIAIRSAIKNGIKLDKREMKEIFDSLFKCKAPTVSPDGKNILRTIGESELEQILKNPRD